MMRVYHADPGAAAQVQYMAAALKALASRRIVRLSPPLCSIPRLPPHGRMPPPDHNLHLMEFSAL
jgi:hypothetical protein